MSTELPFDDVIAGAPDLGVVAEHATPEPPLTVIEPARGWQPFNFRELWAFRELIYFLVWRDVKVRYKQTLLGAAWAVLQPAMLMCVFLFIGRIANLGNNPLFVYLGVLPWSFFATAITNAGNSVVGSERIVTKVYFPRLAIPMASVGAAVVDFAIALCLLVPLMIYYGVAPSLGSLLLVPVIFAIIWLLAMGIGTALAGLNVLYRDFRYVIPFMVQIWMLATPSIYAAPTAAAAAGAHPAIKLLLWLNPMTGLISGFRAAVVGGDLHAGQLAASATLAVLICFAGCFYFRRLESRFADLI